MMENFWFALGLTVFAGLATGMGGLFSVVSRRTSATTPVTMAASAVSPHRMKEAKAAVTRV